jgi:hypothetical protein
MTIRRALAALPALFLLAGCVTNYGPGTIPPARFDYNERIAQSWNEQLLLNLVRLRYRDTPFFLEVGTVLAQYQAVRHAAVGASVGVNHAEPTTLGPALGADFAESPTITYQPLQGEDFVRRLLAPVPGETLLLLAGSGWSAERILLCCANGMNGIPNMPAAAGPTPGTVHADPRYLAAAHLLRRLQAAGGLQSVRGASGGAVSRFRLLPPDGGTAADSAAADSLRSLLRLDPSAGELDLMTDDGTNGAGALRLRLRSLIGTMFYLSQSVEVPAADVAAGLVTDARMPNGGPADWPALSGGIFRVRFADTRPDHAFTAVRYRGHWFYVDDADLESKSTFGLLSTLFSLQSAQTHAVGPLLTVPAGQ